MKSSQVLGGPPSIRYHLHRIPNLGPRHTSPMDHICNLGLSFHASIAAFLPCCKCSLYKYMCTKEQLKGEALNFRRLLDMGKRHSHSQSCRFHFRVCKATVLCTVSSALCVRNLGDISTSTFFAHAYSCSGSTWSESKPL